MKERPITFSAPMVRAILATQKTQTRRTLNPQPELAIMDAESTSALRAAQDVGLVPSADMPRWRWRGTFCMPWPNSIRHASPYGVPGDRLWVRETWSIDPHPGECRGDNPRTPDGGEVMYRATDGWDGPWRSSRYMPRWASRLTLEVTSVRAERLQTISESDALAEAVDPFECPSGPATPCASSAFAELWDSINSKRAPWASNPWVWAITFRRLAAWETTEMVRSSSEQEQQHGS